MRLFVMASIVITTAGYATGAIRKCSTDGSPGSCTGRLYRRTVNVNPVESYTLPRWYKVLGMSLHRGLYCVVLALALTGMLQVAFRGESLGVLGRLGIANFVAENAPLGEFWRDV